MRSSNINEDADHWSDSLERLLLSLPFSLTHISNWCLVRRSAPFRSRVSLVNKQSDQARNRRAHLTCFSSYVLGRNWAGNMLVFKYMLSYSSPLLHFMWRNKLTNFQEVTGSLYYGECCVTANCHPWLLFLMTFLTLPSCLSCLRWW